MATLPQNVPPAAGDGSFAPMAEPIGVLAYSPQDRSALATQVVEQHRKALSARRYRDLTAQKYLLHIDGEGDNQWADIYRGQRVAIPRGLSPYRTQENLLRPVTDNAVAHHTTNPFRFVAETKQDRESRERARVDAALANYLARSQRLNAVFAQAMYLAIPAGFCPVHAYWRDDGQDAYEPLWATDYEGPLPKRGTIDAFVGNPFDHAFNPGARRDSIQWSTYGRVLPVDTVNRAFADVLEKPLEGSDQVPSASVFQQIAQKWQIDNGLNVHGTAAFTHSEKTDEPLIALVCREIAPGIDPEWPDGRLTLVALEGTAETQKGGRKSTTGSPVLLADQPLPAAQFSFSIVYSHHRFDDATGKPWIADLDTLQVELNQGLTWWKEYVKRQIDAPIITPSPLIDDSAEFNGYTLLEMEPSVGGGQPKVMEIPSSVVNAIQEYVKDKRQAIYTIGGYQAASRGESHAGDPAAKVVALARADDTIHGPVNRVFRDTVGDFMQRCWRLMKAYGDVPWVIDTVGEDFGHLASQYIARDDLSDRPPTFRLTSLSGATPEAHAQQLMTLLGMTDPAGTPVLTTDEFRKQWPDQNLFGETETADAVRKRRAKWVASAIRDMAKAYRQQTGMGEDVGMGHPWVQQAGQQVAMAVFQSFPPLPDDDKAAHVDALAELTQDETEDAIARTAAGVRQTYYMQWQAMAAAQMQMGAMGQGQPQPQASPNGPAPQLPAPDPAAGTATSQAMSPQTIGSTVDQLTQQAMGA